MAKGDEGNIRIEGETGNKRRVPKMAEDNKIAEVRTVTRVKRMRRVGMMADEGMTLVTMVTRYEDGIEDGQR